MPARKFNIAPREKLHGIGATDARRIVNGDWVQLYLEKTGQAEPEDLSRVWRVQLGSHTESLHRRWHSQQEGVWIQEFDGAVVHPRHPEYFASLDGYIDITDQPIEFKHTHAHNSLAEAAQFYMAQLQWQLMVTGCDSLRFSIIKGNAEPQWGTIARDQDYIERMMRQVVSFWWHVEHQEAPLAPETDTELEALAKQVPINGMKPYDYSLNNQWCTVELDYADNKQAAVVFEAAKKMLKELVPADASEVRGKLVTVKKDARGALRFV